MVVNENFGDFNDIINQNKLGIQESPIRASDELGRVGTAGAPNSVNTKV